MYSSVGCISICIQDVRCFEIVSSLPKKTIPTVVCTTGNLQFIPIQFVQRKHCICSIADMMTGSCPLHPSMIGLLPYPHIHLKRISYLYRPLHLVIMSTINLEDLELPTLSNLNKGLGRVHILCSYLPLPMCNSNQEFICVYIFIPFVNYN